VVEGTTLPSKDRVQAGVYLGWLGDPRSGVCTLPPAMVRIEGGEFVMGDEDEAHSVTVASFEIGRYPVTNAQYKLFIDDDGYNPDAPWWDEAGRAWLLRDDYVTEGLVRWQKRHYKQHPEWWHHERYGITHPNHPVVGISWHEAVAFCRWLTQNQGYNPDCYVYTLLSEAEWEYAARRAIRRIYPWGNEDPDAEHANFNRVYNNTSAVGCFVPGATPVEQIHDLSGNVWEWVRSEYRSYPYDPDDGREDTDNPADKKFVLRGGGWDDRSHLLRTSFRLDLMPDYRTSVIGFRLVRYPPNKT
jgi:formylglycine-generating enzyme required for sulfatase activity